MTPTTADAASMPVGRPSLLHPGTPQDNLFTRIGVRPLVNGRVIHADQIALQSTMQVPGKYIEWTFQGTVRGRTMAATIDLGEHGKLAWEATKNHD